MLPKLIREDFYDENYTLNEQEFKEFNFVRFDPYWKIRASCYSLGLNCFGDKETLVIRIENLLFTNYLHKRPPTETLRDLARTDIEIIVRKFKCSTGKNDSFQLRDLEAYLNSESHNEVPERQSSKHQWPWQIVPELGKKMNLLSYSDIYRGMTHFMRSSMIFYNHFLEDEPYITAIVALPYTPYMLNSLSPVQIYSIVKSLGMHVNQDIINVVDVMKQKLIDLFYCVEDSKHLHGIVPCQSFFKSCERLASTFCANHLCKDCCQSYQHRQPCIIHDRYEQFFRAKIKSLYLLEETKGFDHNKTIRVFCRKLVRRYELEKAFDGCGVEWDKLATYYHPTSFRIQCVYLVFKSHKDAARVYLDRQVYIAKLEKYDITISALNASLYRIQDTCEHAANMIAIIRPFTSLEIIENLPTGQEYIQSLVQLIQIVTQLDPQSFVVEPDKNTLTEEPDYQHVFVTLPSKHHVDRLYQAQPFFGCLIAHKISHMQICSFMPYNPDSCLMCTSKKDPICINDMCSDCCARQRFGAIICRCSVQLCQSLLAEKKQKIHDGNILPETLCEKCSNNKDSGCSVSMCSVCCPIQSIRNQCKVHDESFYARSLKSLNVHHIPKRMTQAVAEMHLKVRDELKHGRYDWFRPVYGTPFQQEMVRANRELQTVIDNGSIIRGVNALRNKREGKILTFQANEPINTQITHSERIYESINSKGQPFIEHDYTESTSTSGEHVQWIKNSPNKYRTFSKEDFDQYVNAPNRQVAQSFHIMLMGLDKNTYTVRELYQEIQSKLRSSVGQVEQKNIIMLDMDSLLPNIYNSTGVFLKSKNLEQNLNRLGRVAGVKFESILDALALFTGAAKVTLPLNNGTVGEPIVYPSASLIKFIESFDPSTSQLNLKSTGPYFAKEIKELEYHEAQVRNLERRHDDAGDIRRGRKPRGRGIRRGGRGGRDRGRSSRGGLSNPRKKIKQ